MSQKFEYELRKSFTFEAAHQLKYHDGKCARLHGHSFVLTGAVTGTNLFPSLFINRPETGEPVPTKQPKSNMLFDYGDISSIIKPFVESHLDHHFLNETLETDSPTSEYIASFVYGYLSNTFHKLGLTLKEIRIAETCTSEAVYRLIN